MRRVVGIPVPDAADTKIDAEIQLRWIERLQQRAPKPATPLDTGAGEAESWIKRLQQRAANDPR